MGVKRGGLYLWRTRKPHALIGLPLIGRHNGYVGMTGSYSAREGQHLYGSVLYGTDPASWSDLDPKCYQILRLPDFLLRGRWRRRFVKTLETVAIYLLLPVYNERQQAPWNFRKVSRKAAKRARANRGDYGMAYRAMAFGLRMSLNVIGIFIFGYGIVQGWWL